jgi:hypothetical protein
MTSDLYVTGKSPANDHQESMHINLIAGSWRKASGAEQSRPFLDE